MNTCIRSAITAVLTVAASIGHGADRVEVLVDASMEMWQPLSSGVPRIVEVRLAFDAFVNSPAMRDANLDIGLRLIGGSAEMVDGDGCEDSTPVIASGPVVPSQWIEELTKVDPRGGRGLAGALESTIDGLVGDPADTRIVVLTSGDDQCFQDLTASLTEISESENMPTVRIIGLELDHVLASSLVSIVPTRNVRNRAELYQMLRWAVLSSGNEPLRPEWLEMRLARGGTPLTDASLTLVNTLDGEETTTTVEAGTSRARLRPGLYRAVVEGYEVTVTEISGIDHRGIDEVVELELSDTADATIEVDPNRPLAGDVAYVQFWGAPLGNNEVGIAEAGSPPGVYLGMVAASGTNGEVQIALPDSPHELELHFLHGIGSGVRQLVGKLPFSTSRRRLSIDAPDRIENLTPLTTKWNGDALDGDFLAVAEKGSDTSGILACSPTGAAGALTIPAPALPGDYVIRYLSRRGRTLARANLEVFEVLATLDVPFEGAPGSVLSVGWTGPDAEQDYLSISAAGAGDDEYETFIPTAGGNPAQMRAPREPGDYELRYVRAADGQILARTPLVVASARITLEVPPVVAVGTRFEVSWSGAAGEGDFIAVARERSGKKRHLDWSYTNLGSPVSLAAPFETGKYVVRYISGKSEKVVAQASIEVR
jgi:Ca-activated chloride channel family protein